MIITILTGRLQSGRNHYRCRRQCAHKMAIQVMRNGNSSTSRYPDTVYVWTMEIWGLPPERNEVGVPIHTVSMYFSLNSEKYGKNKTAKHQNNASRQTN